MLKPSVDTDGWMLQSSDFLRQTNSSNSDRRNLTESIHNTLKTFKISSIKGYNTYRSNLVLWLILPREGTKIDIGCCFVAYNQRTEIPPIQFFFNLKGHGSSYAFLNVNKIKIKTTIHAFSLFYTSILRNSILANFNRQFRYFYTRETKIVKKGHDSRTYRDN